MSTAYEAQKTLLGNLAQALKTQNRDEISPLWYILSALRGPDVNDSALLKEYTTQRIRAIVGVSMNSDCLVRQTPLAYYERKRRDELLTDEKRFHFARHYNHAVQAIRTLYGYDLLTETPVAGNIANPHQ